MGGMIRKVLMFPLQLIGSVWETCGDLKDATLEGVRGGLRSGGLWVVLIFVTMLGGIGWGVGYEMTTERSAIEYQHVQTMTRLQIDAQIAGAELQYKNNFASAVVNGLYDLGDKFIQYLENVNDTGLKTLRRR